MLSGISSLYYAPRTQNSGEYCSSRDEKTCTVGNISHISTFLFNVFTRSR